MLTDNRSHRMPDQMRCFDLQLIHQRKSIFHEPLYREFAMAGRAARAVQVMTDDLKVIGQDVALGQPDIAAPTQTVDHDYGFACAVRLHNERLVVDFHGYLRFLQYLPSFMTMKILSTS